MKTLLVFYCFLKYYFFMSYRPMFADEDDDDESNKENENTILVGENSLILND